MMRWLILPITIIFVMNFSVMRLDAKQKRHGKKYVVRRNTKQKSLKHLVRKIDCRKDKEGSSSIHPRYLVFTFNDGPTENGRKIIEILTKSGDLRASFFINGWRLQEKLSTSEEAKKILSEIYNRGHVIGNHTMNQNQRMCMMSPDKINREIYMVDELLMKIIGKKADLFRSPYGFQCNPIKTALANYGLSHVGWDIDVNSMGRFQLEEMFDYLRDRIQQMRPGQQFIIVMSESNQYTVQLLQKTLEWVKQENQLCRSKNISPIEWVDAQRIVKGERGDKIDASLKKVTPLWGLVDLLFYGKKDEGE